MAMCGTAAGRTTESRGLAATAALFGGDAGTGPRGAMTRPPQAAPPSTRTSARAEAFMSSPLVHTFYAGPALEDWTAPPAPPLPRAGRLLTLHRLSKFRRAGPASMGR